MSRIFVTPSIIDAVHACKDAVESCDYALEQGKKIISRLESSEWQGESKNCCLNIMRITNKYHNDLKFMLETFGQHLKMLNKDFCDFPHVSVRIKELEGE